jgi:hypothetical protein
MGLLSGIDNFTGWALLQKNSAAIEKAYAADGSDNSDVEYFKKVAPTLTTPDALLKDYRALTFVTTAYGLAGQQDQTALLRKLMTEDPTATTSLAMQLSDNNYRNFASAMSVWAPPPFSSKATIDAAVAGFKEHSYQTSIGTDNTALQEATYFSKNAVGITKLTQIMADKPLLDVVRVSLGIPDTFANLEYDQQKAMLASRVDMAQFATADGVANVVKKYLAMDELNQITAGTSSDPMLSLFNSSSDGSDGSSTPAFTLNAQTLNLLA